MRIAFIRKEDGAELVRVWSESEVVKVPENVGKYRINSIASYAFSNHKQVEDEDVEFFEEDSRAEEFQMQDLPLRCGANLLEIHLPPTVKVIGNYAFYGCMNMKVFHGTDEIVRMGSGVFTGCRLSNVQIDFYEGERSCLKEILTEIRYEIVATLVYGKGKEERFTKIIFPEHYMDAVENTPARIVETHYYGSGGEYRECFYRRELDYLKYDRMFALSGVRDDEAVTVQVALARLMYPVKLEDAARRRYETYIREHLTNLIKDCLKKLDDHENYALGSPVEIVEFICRMEYFERDVLERAIDLASRTGQTEVLSILMDERHRRFPVRKKKFVL